MKYPARPPFSSTRIFWFVAITLLGIAFHAMPSRAAAQQPAAPATNSSASAPAADEHSNAMISDEQKELNIFRHAPIVAKIGQKMGLDVEVTARIFEAINFAIIFLAIFIPLFRILPRILRKRSETLNRDITTAREATTDAKTRLSAVEAKLAGLDEEIRKFRAQVEQDSLEDEKRVKATLEEESARIVAAAEQEIAMAAAQARRGLRHFAADLAIEQAEKQLVLTPEVDRALIAEFIGDVSRNGAGKGGVN